MEDGRGRARGRTPAEPVRRPVESPPLQGAWAARAPPAESDGRPGAMEAVARLERANPTGGVAAGRGRGRGRRNEPDMRVTTLPHPGFVKFGKDGTEVKLASNYFEITSAPDIMMYQYHVDYIPVLDDTRLQKALLREHEKTIGKYIFTGTEMFTPARLPQPYELTSRRRSDDEPIRIIIRLVKEVHPADDMYIQIMNIIMRRCLEMLDLVEIRRDFFDKEAAKRVNTSQREKLEIWPGYLTTIKWHESKLLFNVDFLNKIMRIDTVAEEFNLARRERQFDQNALKAKLIGKIVMTKYNDRTYRIDDIDFDQTAMSTFHLRKENRDITYKEYYDMRYNIKIQFGDFPLLVSRPTRRDRNRGDTQMVYLIPECCVVTGITDEMRKNMHLMRDITSTARAVPSERVNSLMRFMSRIRGKENITRELKYWGLSFSNHLVAVENGRRLAQQKIVQGNSVSYPVNAQKNDWSQQCRNKTMAKMDKNLQSWFVVFPRKLSRETENFIKEIRQTATPMGFVIDKPDLKPIDSDRIDDYTRTIDDTCSSKNYDLVMVVLFSKNHSTDKYSAIKNMTCVKKGIPCQVITRELITQQEQRIKSCATKVMIQIAAKLGCEPWQLALPKTNWMVCGYDTYHDKSQRTAVGAFVASTNDTFTRYMSAVEFHENNEEISIKFKMFVLKALKQYKKQNNDTLPQKIFIYRDGIGTGDIQRVKSIEVDQAKEAIKEAAEIMNVSYNPGLAYIIVSKRINTRFFEKSGHNYGNPPAGVVVDNTVTLKERFDFFLVSQSVNQGTVSPTSYHVIEDTGKTLPDIHQRLAYGLTHLYYNWAGTLSVPAPCQYAHKLAYLVGEHRIEGKIQDNLEHLPYYL